MLFHYPFGYEQPSNEKKEEAIALMAGLQMVLTGLNEKSPSDWQASGNAVRKDGKYLSLLDQKTTKRQKADAGVAENK